MAGLHAKLFYFPYAVSRNGTQHYIVPFFHNLYPYFIATHVTGKKILTRFALKYLNYSYFIRMKL